MNILIKARQYERSTCIHVSFLFPT